MPVEAWLKGLSLAPKTRGHIRSLMHTIFQSAARWELIDKNPINLVRVKGGTKRHHRPMILSIREFLGVLAELVEPYRTMVLVAGCLGLRISEIMALKWSDFESEASTLLVQRSVVHGRVDAVKTEYSQDYVPVDPSLSEALQHYREAICYPTEEGWVFANPRTGRPFHQDSIQKKHLRKAGEAIGFAGELGWHTFRHSYRSWLDETGAPLTVQKELMRHANIQTTINIYGRAMSETKRQANSKVVQMVLRPDAKSMAERSSTEAQSEVASAVIGS